MLGSNSLPYIAIVGRPNVGKSTLFNRVVGQRLALVHNAPGVTRDCRENEANWMGFHVVFADTPGLYDPSAQDVHPEISKGMRNQTMTAVKKAAVVWFIIDGREGCTPYDYDLAQMLRQSGKPVIILVNKSEGKAGLQGYSDALALGLGDVVPISAEHGEGMSDVADILSDLLGSEENDDDDDELDQSSGGEESSTYPLRLLVLGRPNIGKSTLVNALLGEYRQLTADVPGVTRDAITLDWQFQGRPIKLVDTAGIRRKSKIDDAVEHLAVMDATRSMNFAEVVILVIDGSIPLNQHFEKQDLGLAAQVIEEGRALIIAINKWDCVKNQKALLEHLNYELTTHFAQAKGIPCVPISAKNSWNLDQLMEQVLIVEKAWNKRINTADLNRWLQYVCDQHPTPAVSGRRVRLKYMTQKKSRPPTFILFGNQLDELPLSYQRYLTNRLREDFDIPAVPIRFHMRNSKNPYAK